MVSGAVPVVAIDGPSGVGKGTLAQYLCCKTGFNLLDSGAIYRALAFGALQANIDLQNLTRLVDLAEHLPVKFVDSSIVYDGKDVTSKVRTEEVAGVASIVAAIPEVRAALLKRQKGFAQAPGLIADGRDMGTVVFPNAPVKIFLSASAEIRAERRVNQLISQGLSANIAQITSDIRTRDERDRTRATSPLIPAKDAIQIDTTDLTIEQVYQQVMDILWQAGIMK